MEKILDSMLDIFYIMSRFLVIEGVAMRLIHIHVVVAAAAILTAPAAWAQHAPPPTAGRTVDIQGADEWRRDPHFRKFHAALVAAFANGPDKVDAAAFEKRSFAIFRE